MKKLWKTAALAFALGCLAALCLGMKASAAVYTGVFDGSDTVFWQVDTETDTLTIYGAGAVPDKTQGEYPFEEYGVSRYNDSEIRHVVIEDGITWVSSNLRLEERTLSLGKDVSSVRPHGTTVSFWVDPQNPYYTLYDGCLYTKDCSELVAVPYGKEYCSLHPRIEKVVRGRVVKGYQVTEANPTFSVYDGCLYTKDFSELLDCPQQKASLKFHPNLKIIGPNAFSALTELHVVVIPWGVTTLRTSALQGYWAEPDGVINTTTIVLPDTITSVESSRFDSDGLTPARDTRLLYSRNNQLAVERYGQPADDAQWRSYYPDIFPDAVKTGWREEDGGVFYYSLSGQKVTGWQKISPAWYYFGPDGALARNCWVKSGNDWYFLRSANGMMSTNEWVEWYHVQYRTGPSGAAYAGCWAKVDGQWYYFQPGGAMAASQWIYGKDKKWYYVGQDGAMLTNTRTPDGFYVNADGVWVP